MLYRQKRLHSIRNSTLHRNTFIYKLYYQFVSYKIYAWWFLHPLNGKQDLCKQRENSHFTSLPFISFGSVRIEMTRFLSVVHFLLGFLLFISRSRCFKRRPEVIIRKIILHFFFSLDFFKFMSLLGNYIYFLVGKVVTENLAMNGAQLIHHTRIRAQPIKSKQKRQNKTDSAMRDVFSCLYHRTSLAFFPLSIRHEKPQQWTVDRHTNIDIVVRITRFLSRTFYRVSCNFWQTALFKKCHRCASGYV